MSALDGWIDICRTGTWRDARGREVEVTDATLDGIVATHASQDPVPVVVGHPATDAPAYGWVEALRKTGDRLQAKFRDIAPAFRSAVESGAYSGRSIAFKGDGLRHVGFLGGRAPAVPGLAPTQFSAEADTEVAFSVGEDGELAMPEPLKWALRTMADIARGFREDIIAEKGIEAADERIPSWRIDELQRAADDLDGAETGFAGPAKANSNDVQTQTQEEPGMTGTPDNPDEAALAARKADLDAREARIKEQETAAAATARLAAADAALAPHVEAGRVLPAERAKLAALFASLPDDDTTVAFAAAEGDGQVQEKPRATLEGLLAALPVRVRYDKVTGGAAPKPGAAEAKPDDDAIAAEARALMSEASSRGETLTAIQAVDMVRQKHGL